MKRSNFLALIAVGIALIFASFVSADTWGFSGAASLFPEPAIDVEDAGTLARKVPAPEPQQIVCENGVCRIVDNSVPVAPSSTWFSPVSYVGQTAPCPCGCGIAGCNCGMSAASFSYAAGSVEDHLINEHGQSPEVVFSMQPWQRDALHNSLHAGGFRTWGFGVARGNGYGVFGLRARPWFWRVRPFLRARMGW